MTTALDSIKTAIVGNPPVTGKAPSKSGVIRAFAQMQAQLEAAQAGALVLGTRAALFALATVSSANIMAWVTGDPTPAYNGIYQNTGTAGTPAWTRRASIPQFLVTGINVGAGTVNAIQVTTDLAFPTEDGRALLLVPIIGANTTSGPTVSINGLSPIPIITNSGTPVAIGGLTAGGFIAGVLSDTGSKFRLLSDQASAAIVAAAEAAQTGAEAAQAATEAVYAAWAAAAALGGSVILNTVGNGGATYTMSQSVANANMVVAKVGNSDQTPNVGFTVDGTTIEFAEDIPINIPIVVRLMGTYAIPDSTAPVVDAITFITPEMFGAKGDGITDDTIAMQNCWDDGRPVRLSQFKTYIASNILPRDNLRVTGDRTATIKHKAGTDDNLIGPRYVDGFPEDVTWNNVVFEGFILDGNKDNQSFGTSNKQNLIRGKYTNFAFRHLKCINSVRGDIRVTDSRYGVIEYCELIGGGKWSGAVPATGQAAQNIAVSGTTSQGITIRRNYLEGIGEQVFTEYPSYTTGVNNVCIIVENTSYGIDIIENYITKCSNEMIQYIRFTGVFEPLLEFRPGKSIVSGNLLDGQDFSSFGINIGENADDVLFVNNHIRGMRSHGMKVSGWCRGTLISGNVIEDCDGSGINYVSGNVNASGEPFGSARIVDNEVRNCGAHGIAVLGNASGDVVVGLVLKGNICRNNSQASAGASSGIRIAASLTDAIIEGNICFDDQSTKTQAYGLSITVPSGSGGTIERNLVCGNNFQNNLTGSASINASVRNKYAYFGNIEGTNPQLYAAKFSYDLAASSVSSLQTMDASYAGRNLFHSIRPTSDDGANAYGGAIVSFGATAAGVPTFQVHNLSGANQAVGDAYIFAM